jgi:hypothetical protein
MAVVVFTDNNLIGNLLTNYDAQADSILELVLKIREYLKTNPIVSAETVGEIIQEYLDSHPHAGQVTSVNGKTGSVVIGIDDIEDLPGILDACYSAENQPPYPVTSVNGQTGAVVISGGGAVDSVNGKTGAVIIGIDDLAGLAAALANKYSQTNPPPYPVESVNGLTGDVEINTGVLSINGKRGNILLLAIGDIQGLQAALDAKYSASNVPPYPVTSVNGQTGAVTISTGGANFGVATVTTNFDGDWHNFELPADAKISPIPVVIANYAGFSSVKVFADNRACRAYLMDYSGTVVNSSVSLDVIYMKA